MRRYKMTHPRSTLNNEIFNAIKHNFWSVYESHTVILSNICRQLAFAEGGICWFYISNVNHLRPSTEISSIFFYLILFFIVDALQYLVNSIIYASVAFYYERKNNKNEISNVRDVDRQHWMNIIPMLIYAGKLFLISKSSYLIIHLLIK